MFKPKYIFQFLLAVLLQVLLFNHIFFMGYMNPYVYIIFLLYLPISINRVALMLIAFLLGFCIDVFENSGGIHISASLILAYLRPSLLKLASRRQGTDLEDLKIKNLGLPNMLIYALFAVFIHHFMLFTLESFSFSKLNITLLRTIQSTLFTMVFVFILQLWNYRRKA